MHILKAALSLTFNQLLSCFVHFGHSKKATLLVSTWFAYAQRENIYIIDLLKTVYFYRVGKMLLSSVILKRGSCLLVGRGEDNFVYRRLLFSLSFLCGEVAFPATRSGGLLTNPRGFMWTSTKLIDKHKMLKAKRKIKPKILRFDYWTFFKTLARIKRLPSIVIIFNVLEGIWIAREAHFLKIPVIGIVDTNVSSDFISVPIPGNDDSITTLILYKTIFAKIILNFKLKVINKWRHLTKLKQLYLRRCRRRTFWRLYKRWKERRKYWKFKQRRWRNSYRYRRR